MTGPVFLISASSKTRSVLQSQLYIPGHCKAMKCSDRDRLANFLDWVYLWLLHNNNKTMRWLIRPRLCFLQILPNFFSSTTVQPRSTANPHSSCSYVLFFVSMFNVHKCRCWRTHWLIIHPVVICLRQSLTFLTELFTQRLCGFYNIYNKIIATFEPYAFSNSWHFL